MDTKTKGNQGYVCPESEVVFLLSENALLQTIGSGGDDYGGGGGIIGGDGDDFGD